MRRLLPGMRKGEGCMSPPKPLPDHGTRQRYIHRSHPCRCTRCREANNLYISDYRIRRKNNGNRKLTVRFSHPSAQVGKPPVRARLGGGFAVVQ